MTPASDRQQIISLIDAATEAGACLKAACTALGLSVRTLQRWKNPTDGKGQDRRPSAQRRAPANKLSEEERDQIVTTCNAVEFASLPPSQIVPRLADEGMYIGSESTFYRVLRARGQNHRRGRARPATRRKPPARFEAKALCMSGVGIVCVEAARSSPGARTSRPRSAPARDPENRICHKA
jgi:putative transposase